MSSQRFSSRATMTALVLVLMTASTFLPSIAQAQVASIGQRCLTPQERKSYTNTYPSIQLAGDSCNVGIGQPLYLEALVTKGTVVTQVNWTLVSKPGGSTATLQVSPLTNNTYDVGDQNTNDVAGRRILVPDVASTTGYKVTADLFLTNKTISATNTFYGERYLGAETCLGCHDTITNFSLTAHATAFARKISGSDGAAFKSTCVSCHSVGYDTNALAVNDGFDDIALSVGWTFPTNLSMTNMIMAPSGWNFPSNIVVTNLAATNWSSIDVSLQEKANIQCENCHGAGGSHNGNTNRISISLSAGNCGQCHDSKNTHIKNYEWSQTLHATGYVFRASGSCAGCHSAKGFVYRTDSDYAATDTNKWPRATGNEGITCAACHDPHSTGMGAQLREVTSVTLSNNVLITQGGEGLLCMSCHHDRYDANTRVLTLSTSHYGVQADMLAGKNAIEYGMTMPSSRHLDVVENSCVECHMQTTSTNALAKYNVGEHTFKNRWDAGTPGDESDDIVLTETCAGCHGEIDDFNFGGTDFDQDGTVEGVQKEITDMMYNLAVLLPPYTGTNIVTNGWTTGSSDYSKRAAAYNWNFVKKDGSYGVHNAKYAAAVLRASIDDLKGGVGIDVDHDGLTDSWEISKFGNLTSQTGSGDADSDGVSNALEMSAGTNPNSSDSDSDTFSDLVELQGGSDPLSAGSTLSTNFVTILPAIELGYLPGTMGVTQQFQSISTLIGGSWTNIGSNFVSSNTLFYQLWSTHSTNQSFFRVKSVP